MTLLIGALTMGFILALLALGVYLSYRIFNIPDLTAEGSVTLGASVAATLMVNLLGGTRHHDHRARGPKPYLQGLRPSRTGE